VNQPTTQHTPAAILSAYTGILMCDFSDMHAYIDSLPGCEGVMTHSLPGLMESGTLRRLIKESGDFGRAMASLMAVPDLIEACKKSNACASLPDHTRELCRAAIAKATVK